MISLALDSLLKPAAASHCRTNRPGYCPTYHRSLLAGRCGLDGMEGVKTEICSTPKP